MKSAKVTYFGKNRGDGKLKTCSNLKVSQSKDGRKSSMQIGNKNNIFSNKKPTTHGKGDSPRSCFSKEFRENYENIFGKREKGKSGSSFKKKH